jgi:hypothetical protein
MFCGGSGFDLPLFEVTSESQQRQQSPIDAIRSPRGGPDKFRVADKTGTIATAMAMMDAHSQLGSSGDAALYRGDDGCKPRSSVLTKS